MCGFVGFLSLRRFGELAEDLPRAGERLLHRGPDDAGLFFDAAAGVGLVHRRLAIIDLSPAGRQPMVGRDGHVRLVYNGEVYNYRSLRHRLEGLGHVFRTATDTEVVLNAYLQWGIGCLDRFVGMFALAVWDGRNRVLTLARDRLGIKPLYYHLGPDCFLFASELKALLALRTFPRQIDPAALPGFFHYQYVPAPGSVFRNTYKLLPGHWARFDGRHLRSGRYWHVGTGDGSPRNTAPVPVDEAAQVLDRHLTRAVGDRMVSDVPLGALLSGGIDSSLVAALMQKVHGGPVRTFSIGFRESAYNEAPWARRVAEHLGTDHTEFTVTAQEALEVIPHLPEMYDEPFADSSAIPTFLVCRLARTRVTVALSGDGGDEQFSGYVRYWSTQSAARALGRIPAAGRGALAKLLARLPAESVERFYRPLRGRLPQRFQVANFPDKWQKLARLLQEASVEELYRMTVCLWPRDCLWDLVNVPLTRGVFEEIFEETEGRPHMERFMRVDLQTYLPDAMLTKVDRASMAVSLELRVPLLDHRVVEYSFGLPVDLKYRAGRGKFLLRRVLAQYVPPALFERPKMGFGIPLDHWLRHPLRELMLDTLSPDRLRREGLLNARVVETVLAEHLSGRNNHAHRLWALLMWEMWRQTWLDS